MYNNKYVIHDSEKEYTFPVLDSTLNYMFCKLLHRVIFEDFYKCDLDDEFPDGVRIHHIDGNRTNNEIWNFEPISASEHQRLHQNGEKNNMYGKPCSEQRK